MKCYVSGRSVDPGAVGPPAMNYGQHHRWGDKAQLQYHYEMPLSEFVNVANPWFEQCRKELAEDAGSDPPGTFPELDKFEELGFPSLQSMIDGHPAALSDLMCWFALDLNNSFAGVSHFKCVYYSTNSVDWFRVEGNTVSFGGIA